MRGLKTIRIGQRFVNAVFVFLNLLILYLQYLNHYIIPASKILVQDGAEIGYGAKAQEVLGQVRGRYIFVHKLT